MIKPEVNPEVIAEAVRSQSKDVRDDDVNYEVTRAQRLAVALAEAQDHREPLGS